jgi:outer membrane cobalamin receptor
VIQGSLFISDSDRGTAGSISFPSPSARRTNELLLANAKVMRLVSLGHVTANMSHRFNDEHYNDGSTEPSEHHVSSDKLSVNWNQKWTIMLSTVSSVSIRQESILKSTSVGSRKRNHFSGNIVTNFSLFSLFSIRSGIRFDKSSSQNTTYHIQCSVGLPFDGQLTAGTGTGYRLPTFNDLYWPNGAYTAGNTSLVPEESSMKSLGVDFNLTKKGSFGMHWRLRNSTNLITWAAGFGGRKIWTKLPGKRQQFLSRFPNGFMDLPFQGMFPQSVQKMNPQGNV